MTEQITITPAIAFCQFCGARAVVVLPRIDGTPTPFCKKCLGMAAESPAFPTAWEWLHPDHE
jgi:hypothetical protein